MQEGRRDLGLPWNGIIPTTVYAAQRCDETLLRVEAEL